MRGKTTVWLLDEPLASMPSDHNFATMHTRAAIVSLNDHSATAMLAVHLSERILNARNLTPLPRTQIPRTLFLVQLLYWNVFAKDRYLLSRSLQPCSTHTSSSVYPHTVIMVHLKSSLPFSLVVLGYLHSTVCLAAALRNPGNLRITQLCTARPHVSLPDDNRDRSYNTSSGLPHLRSTASKRMARPYHP